MAVKATVMLTLESFMSAVHEQNLYIRHPSRPRYRRRRRLLQKVFFSISISTQKTSLHCYFTYI